MTCPRVSIILSAKDAAGTVSETVVSILDQNLREWELLAIDRGSTDDTQRVLTELGRGEERVRRIEAPGSGLGTCWNRGIEEARGAYLLFIEAGDWLMPDALARLVSAAESSPSGASFGRYERRGMSGEELGGPIPLPALSVGLDEMLESKPFPIHAQLIARRTLGGERFREDFGASTDLELWLRLARKGVRWTGADEVVAMQRLRAPASALECKTAAAEALRAIPASAGAAPTGRIARELALAIATMSLACRQDLGVNELANILLLTPGRLEEDLDRVAPRKDPEPIDGASSVWDLLPAPLGFAPARWWHRCGYCGPAPRAFVEHVQSGLAAIVGSEDRAPYKIVDECDTSRPILLLGFGKNARRIAHVLRERGLPIRGRDDGLREPPQWAREDRLQVELIPADAPWDASATYLMTVLYDDEFMKRLPAGLRVVRWRDVLASIAAEKQAWSRAWAA